MTVSKTFSPRDIYSRFVCGSLSENFKGLKTFAWNMLTACGSIYTLKKKKVVGFELPKK
jgi:hypothetical protein